MRLIDADEHISELTEDLKRYENKQEIVSRCMVGALNLAIEAVSCAPTVDAKPVEHSHWDSFTHDALMGFDEFDEPIWKPKIVYHCHNCRRKTVIKEKYCPNCAAKMDEVSE